MCVRIVNRMYPHRAQLQLPVFLVRVRRRGSGEPSPRIHVCFESGNYWFGLSQASDDLALNKA